VHRCTSPCAEATVIAAIPKLPPLWSSRTSLSDGLSPLLCAKSSRSIDAQHTHAFCMHASLFIVIAGIDDEYYRVWLRDSARTEFRMHANEQDEKEVTALIAKGKKQLADTLAMIAQATNGF